MLLILPYLSWLRLPGRSTQLIKRFTAEIKHLTYTYAVVVYKESDSIKYTILTYEVQNRNFYKAHICKNNFYRALCTTKDRTKTQHSKLKNTVKITIL